MDSIYLAYGSWLAGGCSTGETCWLFTCKPLVHALANLLLVPVLAQVQKVHQGIFYDYNCVPTDFPDTRLVTTQIGSLSVELYMYNPMEAASTTTPTSKMTTPSGIESATFSLLLATGSSPPSTISQPTGTPSSSDLSASAGADRLNIGAKVGSILRRDIWICRRHCSYLFWAENTQIEEGRCLVAIYAKQSTKVIYYYSVSDCYSNTICLRTAVLGRNIFRGCKSIRMKLFGEFYLYDPGTNRS
jgi:hypothetical protein